MQEKIEILEKMINELIEENKKLTIVIDSQGKRISELEKKIAPKKDHRKKDGVKKVLGFSLSDVNNYFHAVKTVGGEQLRVYVGRDASLAKERIIQAMINEFRFRKSSIKLCRELSQVPEIKELLEKDIANEKPQVVE